MQNVASENGRLRLQLQRQLVVEGFRELRRLGRRRARVRLRLRRGQQPVLHLQVGVAYSGQADKSSD